MYVIVGIALLVETLAVLSLMNHKNLSIFISVKWEYAYSQLPNRLYNDYARTLQLVTQYICIYWLKTLELQIINDHQ